MVVLVVVALVSIAVVGVGERFDIAWPALMVVVATGTGLVPAWRDVHIEPDLILPLFLPPLLFATAQRTSWGLFRRRWRSVLGLALALTAASIAAVAGTVWLLVPGITLAAAIAVGAAVSPPDPVAVEAVAAPLGIPRRLVAVLQSEGLFNDAVALVVFQTAVAAAVQQEPFGAMVVGRFLFGLLAAVGVGVAMGAGALWLRSRLTTVAARNAITLVLPFAVYLVAEELHASGVVAVVVTALQVGAQQMPDQVEDRLSATALWEVIELVVTGLAFGLIGIELGAAARDAGTHLPSMVGTGVVVGLVLLGLRVVWLLAWRPIIVRTGDPTAAPRTVREALVLAWCGMRGLATLALALAIPMTVGDGSPMPGRTQLVVIAATVIVMTLLVPAFTLPYVVRALGMGREAERERAAEAKVAVRARDAALAHLRTMPGLAHLPEERALQVRAALAELEAVLLDQPSGEARGRLAEVQRRRALVLHLQSEGLSAARREVLVARGERGIDPEAADRVLRRLDLLARPVRRSRPLRRPEGDPAQG
ncbi:cation:proton antiporter [Actinotalea ferrariae]|uniref:cation:proton antiporter n=1 Tax=Actinotalea ferrariae TaxID=1386098 RepID=UPI001EB67AC8|nr:cation:proton antiporter [Actinotalea ferrariae]MBX9244721.1 cation:proton antiporter [Actinotalea ferrariae]